MIRAMPIDTATWGEFDPSVFARIVVVSPHFDDAAMGAGHLLASYPDTTVVTVLGGPPPAYPDEPSEWDALGGFKPGDDVVAARRLEDVDAMAVLESAYRWLEFADHQYLARADRPRAEVATFAGLTVDFKHIPGLLAWRVAKLLRSHPWPTPAIVPHEPDEERKRKAIWCYTSQIPPLENEHALTARLDGHVPEQFWHLAPPPHGWEGLAELI